MAKKTRSYNVLLIGVLGLLAVGTWAFFDVYRGLTSQTLTEVQQKLLQPLRVGVGPELMTRLRARRQFDEAYLGSVESREVPLQDRGETVVLSPTPTPIIAPSGAEATQSAASPTPTPTIAAATGSAGF